MALFKRKKEQRKNYVDATIQNGWEISIMDQEEGLYFLIDLFQKVRPRRLPFFHHSDDNLKAIIGQLEEFPQLKKNLQIAFLTQLVNTKLEPALTQSGLMLGQGFMQELTRRLHYKILPPLQDSNDFLYVLNHIFYKSSDYLWVESIERNTWIQFFQTIGITDSSKTYTIENQLVRSMMVLSYKVANLGLDEALLSYADNLFTLENNPFVLQNSICIELNNLLQEGEGAFKTNSTGLSQKLDDLILASLTSLKNIQNNQALNGASIALTYTTLIIEACLLRLRLLNNSIDENKSFQVGNYVDFFRMLVRNEKRKTSIRELFSQGFGYVAYQIAEHKGHKGDKYITSTRKSWFRMVYTAAWGGVIICFVAIFKMLLHLLQIPPFWLGVAYSVNYSAGFVAIEETGSTLATKQPAFTASAIASSLDVKKNNGQANLYSLAVTVARTFRSQNASFLGNLMIVFPGSYFLAWAYDKIFGHKIIDGMHAYNNLQDQHPWYSLSLLYACNAGFFLFITGLLAGYVANKMQYEHVSERIQQHPILNLTTSKSRRKKIGDYIEHHSGALAGNIAFGFLMGMSSVITQIFGIKFDVRHVTIAAANTSLSVYGIGFHNLKWSYLLTVIAGVLGIGVLNFAVSFSLAFIVALKSRNIRLRDFPEFFKILWHYFRKHPLRFFFPVKEVKE